MFCSNCIYYKFLKCTKHDKFTLATSPICKDMEPTAGFIAFLKWLKGKDR